RPRIEKSRYRAGPRFGGFGCVGDLASDLGPPSQRKKSIRRARQALRPVPKMETDDLHGRRLMPMLTVEGVGTFDVPPGKRLVLALEDEAKIDQLHACGGNARCTTCRVEFVSGEPPTMTNGERTVLAAKGLTGVRLSCQI